MNCNAVDRFAELVSNKYYGHQNWSYLNETSKDVWREAIKALMPEIMLMLLAQTHRIATLEQVLKNENARIIELLKINLEQTKTIMDQAIIISSHTKDN